jgi:hypothetical protein
VDRAALYVALDQLLIARPVPHRVGRVRESQLLAALADAAGVPDAVDARLYGHDDDLSIRLFSLPARPMGCRSRLPSP